MLVVGVGVVGLGLVVLVVGGRRTGHPGGAGMGTKAATASSTGVVASATVSINPRLNAQEDRLTRTGRR